jgi:hypothetical protein
MAQIVSQTVELFPVVMVWCGIASCAEMVLSTG